MLDDEGHIEGLLSLSDLTRALYGKPRPKAKHLSPEHISAMESFEGHALRG